MIYKQNGVSLLEVLIAFLLLGVGALGLTKLNVYLERESEHAINTIEALRLAENKLEWFRTRGASSASPAMPVADFDTIVTGSSSVGDYTLQWQVPPATVSSSLKAITMTASWKDRLGETQSIQLKTMISRFSEFDN